MKLDAQTLFASMFINVTMISVALFFGVRGKGLSGIRAWNASLVLQAIGWAGLIGAYQIWPRQLATLGVTALVGCFSLVHLTIKHYLRRPFSRAWVYGLPLLVGVIHWFVFDNFVARVAIINAALGAQMLWLAWLLMRPNPTGLRWRWLAGVALASAGAMVVARLWLVVFDPQSYPKFESSHWVNILGLIISNANLMIGTMAFLLAHRDEAEQELLRLASVDGLTGVLNRRSVLEQGAAQLKLAKRHGQPMALLMLDIDHFKQINDNHGHQAGDRALVLFAQAMQQMVRQPDLVGRYGGEEFCVLLPMAAGNAAQAVDRRLRDMVRTQVSPTLGLDLTFSAGATELREEDHSLDDLIGRADRALYAAKVGGRNRFEAG